MTPDTPANPAPSAADNSAHSFTEGADVPPAPTPRTEASLKSRNHLPEWFGDVVSADFARTLERELTSAQAAIAAKDAEIAKATNLQRLYFNNMNTYDKWYRELVEAVYEGGCDGVNERPDPRTVIKNIRAERDEMKARAEKAEAELARLKSENESLRTLWTEARDVVTQGRNANCVVSYGKAQCDAVAAANAWLDKMPATVKRTIDDASNTEWQLQRVIAERDQLRAEVEKLRQERAEWMPMYRRDYGHDWDKRTKYEGF